MKRVFLAATAVLLIVGPPSIGAWQVKSFYPMSVDPALPTPAAAQSMVSRPVGILAKLRHAHRQSLQRGWAGASPNSLSEAPLAAEQTTGNHPVVSD
jgi:hypothetical protein